MVHMKSELQTSAGRGRTVTFNVAATPAIDPETAWRQLLARDPAANFSMQSRPPASFAGPVAGAGGLCGPTCASSARQVRRRRPAFALPALPPCCPSGGQTFGGDPTTYRGPPGPRSFTQRVGARGGNEPLHRAEALQAGDGRDSARIPTRAAGCPPARRAQTGRQCDGCDL